MLWPSAVVNCFEAYASDQTMNYVTCNDVYGLRCKLEDPKINSQSFKFFVHFVFNGLARLILSSPSVCCAVKDKGLVGKGFNLAK